MKTAEALRHLRDELEKLTIEQPLLEAELLMMDSLGVTRTGLHLDGDKDFPSELMPALYERIARRGRGEPMAYILGHRDFYKSRFKVKPGVLIPRPESEVIVETALSFGPKTALADLGCGTGCLGLSLLLEWPGSRLWTCDISETAIGLLGENALALKVLDRVKYSKSDVLKNDFSEEFDLVVSNPPYIDKFDARIEPNVKKYEPAEALFAGDEGLQFYKAWLPWAYKALKKNGHVVFEVGAGQAGDVKKIAQAAGFINVGAVRDLDRIERVVHAQKG